MPLDPTTPEDNGQYSNFAFSLDTHSQVAGQQSIFDDAADFVTKAVPLTGLAIVNSFVNTGVMVDNWFGGDAKQLTIQDEVGEGDLNDYYKAHSQGIEGAALLAGSLIPGLAAVKVLKLAQLGKLTNAVKVATNIFAGPKDALVDGALQSILNPETSTLQSLTAQKIKAVALGFGDQALQGMVYEAATDAAMHGSPLLDKQGLKDTVDNVTFGALAGGVVGGTIEGVQTLWAFRKAALAASKEISPATNVERTSDFQKQILAGDRALSIVQSIDKLDGVNKQDLLSGTSLGRARLSQNVETSLLDAKLAIKDIAPDPAIASDFIDSLRVARANGVTADEQYNRLSRLAKVTRITDDYEQPVGDVVYLNRFTSSTPGVDFSQLITKDPAKGASVSRAYRLASDATDISIAHFADKLDPAGVFGDATAGVGKFANASEAFAAGHDIFINKDLIPIVNPKSQSLVLAARPGESRPLTIREEKLYRETGQLPKGAAPLLGGAPKAGEAFEPGNFTNKPLIYNLTDGSISDLATPVVGDFGKVEATSDGLRFGDKFSPLQDLTVETPTTDANAQYVWAATKGLKIGDHIADDNLPMLEQLYRESSKAPDFQKFLETKKLTLGEDLKASVTDNANLGEYIRQKKVGFISDLMKSDTKLSADDLSLRANVPKDFIANGMTDTDPAKFMRDPLKDQSAQHVKLWYDIGNINQNDGMILKGAIDTQYRINLIKDTAQTNLADFISKFSTNSDHTRFIIDKSSSDATLLGSKQSFLASMYGDYNSLAQSAERTGRHVAMYGDERGGVIAKTLSPSVNGLRSDPAGAGAEASMFYFVRHRTNQLFKFLPEDLQAQHFPEVTDGSRIAVLRDSIQLDKETGSYIWDKGYMPDNFISGDGSASQEVGNYNYYKLSPKVAAFEEANRGLNSQRVYARNNLRAANGQNPLNGDPDTLYAPPLDTSVYKHFALVKALPGTGAADDSVGMIVARNGEELQAKIARLDPSEFSVWTKDMGAKYHEVLGDYQASRNFAQNKVNSELAKRGILSDIYPDTRVDSLIQRYNDWHTRSEIQLIRDHVESANGQLFTELKAMSDQYMATSKSTFGQGNLLESKFDPYKSYIDTALNIQQKDNYRPWYMANEKLEAFFDTAFSTARTAFEAATKNRITYDQAIAAAQKFGLGDIYGEGLKAVQTFNNLADKLPPQRYLANFISQASAAMNYTVIRLDAWQQLVHVLSTPILLNAELASATKEVPDALRQLTHIELPDGSGRQVPGVSKIFFKAVNNLFDTAHMDQWKPVYESIGAIRNAESELLHRQMREEMTLPFGRAWTQEGLGKLGASIVQKASQLSNWTEFVQSFVTADSARQLFEAKGYTGRELLDNISSFVNRVKGNIVASQRPVAFQGPLGQSVGLFQTYTFNMMNQLFRYVGNGEGKPLAIVAGMQSSLFGLSSLPGYHFINSSIIGNAQGNTGHGDIYSTLPSYFGSKIADYLLYGTASNVLNASLYTRGDMNPRNISLLPVNPLNFPAISGGIRLYQSLAGIADKIAQGGSIPGSILLGLEHNGLSRPLQGIAQLAQGFSTASNGQLQSRAWPSMSFDPLGSPVSGLNELYNAGVFARLLGARPLDEAIAMDAQYRAGLYRAKDTARIDELGKAVKTKLYGGGTPTEDEVTNFASEYARAGGRIDEFGRHMIIWSTQANTSAANEIYRHLEKPLNRQMMMIMGGQQLPDFSGAGSTRSSGSQVP